jgi:hypothetical protein
VVVEVVGGKAAAAAAVGAVVTIVVVKGTCGIGRKLLWRRCCEYGGRLSTCLVSARVAQAAKRWMVFVLFSSLKAAAVVVRYGLS